MKKLEISILIFLAISLILQVIIFFKVFYSEKNLSQINDNLSRLELVEE